MNSALNAVKSPSERFGLQTSKYRVKKRGIALDLTSDMTSYWTKPS